MFSSLIEKIDTEALGQLLAYDARNPLLFNTGLFMLLFLGMLAIYTLLRRWPVAKMLFVIAFSLYFYYKSSAECCFILMGVCFSDYLLGLWLGASSARWLRRSIVALNVVINIGMLVYFKYFNLIYETFANITNTHFDALNIILPAGISFFTFRSISYMVDIYRGKMAPCRNFLDYTFFLTFFPPLLAGPVVRARDMIPQIQARPEATREMVGEGLFLVMSGLIKKMVISDYIGINFVDRIFENPTLYTGFENLMGTIGYTLQIYCDFSGYSDMAIGIALLLGFRFLQNFDAPFKSQSPSEFWNRWHISLSSWLKDYLYIPLGGNRKGKTRQHVNLMTTMVLGGLWHGASPMYIIWGAYQGVMLVLHKSIKRVWHLPDFMRGSWYVVAANVFITFVLTVIGFTIFRCSDLEKFGQIGTQIFTSFHPEIAAEFAKAYALILVAIGVGYALHFSPKAWSKKVMGGYIAMPILAQAIVLAIVIFIVIQTRQSDLVPFVYLQY